MHEQLEALQIYIGGTMSVKIRMTRMGSNKKPFYRVVVADSRSPRDGRFIEQLGYYDPRAKEGGLKLDVEKANEWIKNGAKPTETVKKLIKRVEENEQ